MKQAYVKGISYGITSGVITTLGLIIGLYFSSGDKNIIVAGILSIAFADAFSDGLGIHLSEESDNRHSEKQIWVSTISTIAAKMFFALTFTVPILLTTLGLALIIDTIWGISLLSALSIMIATKNHKKVMPFLFEHVGIGIIVIIGSFIVGKIIPAIIK